jgi:hypothetical protein
MIALFRFIVRFFKKEQVLLHRYERTHPHFVWYVLVDAVISVSLVFGGFAIVRSLSAPSQAQIEIEDAGGVSLSADGLFRHFQREKRVAYWLGPKAGNSYAPTGVEKDMVTITYLSDGVAGLSKINEPKLTIQTYDSEAILEAHGQGLIHTDRTWTWNSRGDEISYDIHFMDFVVVKLKNAIQMVQINYPNARSSSSMLKDSVALRRVW